MPYRLSALLPSAGTHPLGAPHHGLLPHLSPVRRSSAGTRYWSTPSPSPDGFWPPGAPRHQERGPPGFPLPPVTRVHRPGVSHYYGWCLTPRTAYARRLGHPLAASYWSGGSSGHGARHELRLHPRRYEASLDHSANFPPNASVLTSAGPPVIGLPTPCKVTRRPPPTSVRSRYVPGFVSGPSRPRLTTTPCPSTSTSDWSAACGRSLTSKLTELPGVHENLPSPHGTGESPAVPPMLNPAPGFPLPVRAATPPQPIPPPANGGVPAPPTHPGAAGLQRSGSGGNFRRAAERGLSVTAPLPCAPHRRLTFLHQRR